MKCYNEINTDFPLQVTRVESPSIEEFNRLYAEPAKPVLITGIASKWKAYSLWTPQYFKSLAGNRSVPVKHMYNGDYLGARTIMMPLANYLDSVNHPTDNVRFYLSQQLIGQIFPEIVGDYTVPPYINSPKFISTCYIGSHVHSQIHFHRYGKALLCVVSGCKKVKLFAPDQTPFLYQKYNFSKIEGEPVDLSAYPLYGKAQYYECEVKSGEMLFLPIYWWHGVETVEFSCAVVFFWDDSRKLRWSPPIGISWYYPLLFEAELLIIKGKEFISKILM